MALLVPSWPELDQPASGLKAMQIAALTASLPAQQIASSSIYGLTSAHLTACTVDGASCAAEPLGSAALCSRTLTEVCAAGVRSAALTLAYSMMDAPTMLPAGLVATRSIMSCIMLVQASGSALTLVDAVVAASAQHRQNLTAVAQGKRRPDAAVPSGFSIGRPPGHHATATEPLGFCLFNNVAIAARYAQQKHGLKKVRAEWSVESSLQAGAGHVQAACTLCVQHRHVLCCPGIVRACP